MARAEEITKLVHQQGGRMTRQRRLVMEVLASLDTHPTAQELYELVRERVPTISPATVYRNLKLLHDLGCVLELDYGPGPTRYDATVTDHCHARCTRCGRVVDVPVADVADAATAAAAMSDWLITGCRVELYGLCPKCRDANNRKTQPEGAR